jgi:antitoxin PrlF
MVVEEICTITAKGQTTIPKTVRQALGVGYGARIAFRIENGTVTVHPADNDAADPALAPFLDLLARDIASRPEALVPLPKTLLARIERLTKGITVDLDAPIEGDVVL